VRKLKVTTFVTLDGVMQAPGGPEEDPGAGFAYGGWSVGHWDEVMGNTMGEIMSQPFDLLLGRRTYEIFAAHWPHAGDNPITHAFNQATKYVASRTLSRLEWVNSRLLEGDAARAVAQLKKEDGRALQVHGSGQLLQSLMANGLIDEHWLWIFPIVLGQGKKLFGQGTVPAKFSLAGSRTSSTGVMINTYRPAGAVTTGSFAHSEPTEAEKKRREKWAREQ
jgi:dihydrofolate reductase